MIIYNVSIPENKQSFFQEFLEMIGAKYEIKEVFELSKEQKKILLEQENISIEACTDAEEFYKELKEKYEL